MFTSPTYIVVSACVQLLSTLNALCLRPVFTHSTSAPHWRRPDFGVASGEAPCGLWEGPPQQTGAERSHRPQWRPSSGYARWPRLEIGCSSQMRLFSSEDFPTVSRLGARAPWWRGPMLLQCPTAAVCVSCIFRSVGDVRPKCLFSRMNSKQLVQICILTPSLFLWEPLTALRPPLPLCNCPSGYRGLCYPEPQHTTGGLVLPFPSSIQPHHLNHYDLCAHNQSHCIGPFYDTDSLPQCLLGSFTAHHRHLKTKQRFVVRQL